MIKLLLSKRERGKNRHIVMTCSNSESTTIRPIIWEEVLQKDAYPVTERYKVRENGHVEYMVRFRFAMKYLDRLMLTFPMADWSSALERRVSQRVREKLAAEPVPNLRLPDFRGDLWDFQKVAVGRMLPTEQSRFLLEHEMGLGKTYSCLATLTAKHAYPAIIIVKNSNKPVWERFVERLTDCTYATLSGNAYQRAEILEQTPDILIVNHEALRVRRRRATPVEDRSHINPATNKPWLYYEFVNPGLFFRGNDAYISEWREDELANAKRRVWRMAVVDEDHAFKNPDAQQSVGVRNIRAKRKLGMTGTPVLNGRIEERWTMLNWLWPDKFPNYNQFISTHVIKKAGRVIAYRGLAELREFIEQHSHRLRKDQIEADLPEVIYVDRYVELTAEQRRLYEQIEDEYLIWVNEEPRNIVSVLAQITRLKQACFSPELYGGSPHSAKMDELKDIVEELVANGEKAIIFSQWKTATRIIERELAEYNPAYVDGTVSVNERMVQVDRFNNDEDCKLFIGTIGSCREGFSLSAATYVIFTDKGWTPAENQQAAARSAAGGLRGLGTSHVHIIELKALDTIEQDIDALLERKQRMNTRIVESDNGAPVERIEVTDITDLIRRRRAPSPADVELAG